MALLPILAVLALVALFLRSPVRTLWGLLLGALAVLVLAELVGVRGALVAGGALTTLVALGGRKRLLRAGPTPPIETASARAWGRLQATGGFWFKGRIATLRQRHDAVAASTAQCDPFSPAGELRLKLERYIPELIDNMLDDHARAAPAKRRAILSEMLAEIDRFLTRLEAADPNHERLAERREALKTHLRRGEGE